MTRFPILALFVAAGALAYVGTIALTPRVLMHAVMARTIEDTGGVNRMHHSARIDAGIRRVVRPLRDFFYSSCAFDLTEAPVRVSADVPEGSYWSASGYAADTENFFTLNDRETDTGAVDILILPGRDVEIDDASLREGAKTHLVHAPSDRGIILIRTLIEDEARADALDETRRRATCAPLK